jgi:adenylate cyclase
MSSSPWKFAWSHAAAGVPVLVVLAGLALLAADPAPLAALRNLAFDHYQRWQPRAYRAAPVRIVDIDEASLARLGQWPWPRNRMAELVDRLNATGVAAIGLDMMFVEADRTAPRAMADLWRLPGALRRELLDLPDHDRLFAASLARAPVVLGFSEGAARPGDALAGVARPYRHVQLGQPSLAVLPAIDGAIASLPDLQAAAKGHGAMTFKADGDGVLRRVPMALRLAGQPLASLSAETLRVGQGARNYILKSAAQGDAALAEVRIGDFSVPTTAQGEVWVHYSDPVPGRYIPAWRVLAGAVPAAELEGRLVLVGTSAQGLLDLRFNSLGRILPGVEAHAQVLEQILTGHFLQRPSWARGAEALVLAVGGLGLGLLALRARALLAAGVTLASLAGLMWGGWHAFAAHGLLLDTLTPALAIAASFVLASLAHHALSERRQRWIKAAFSRYVSPNLVEHLVSHPGQLELGGQRRECSFVFTDLAGFTALMERIDPGEAVSLLNDYLDGLIGIAFRHEGTLDRIVGDAVAIMFSAPVAQPDHRARALACALEMDAYAQDYAEALRARGIPFGMTRIGVHSGEVIVGNFGGSTIFDYRALGDPVNTASRLESANKHLGTRLCVSEATLSGCPDIPARPVGRLTLKGKTQALSVFAPVLADQAVGWAPVADYQAAYAAMRAEDGAGAPPEQARDRFLDLAARYPDDSLVALHSRRLAAGERGDMIVLREK